MKKTKKFLLIVITLAVIIALSVVGVCGYFGYFKKVTNNIEPKDNQIKVACVGDSITYGMAVKNWYKNSYPKKLQKQLGDSYCVNNFGYSGATAMESGNLPYKKLNVYQESIEFNADIIVIMLGSNDSKTNNWQGKEEFKRQYKNLINDYVTLPNNPKVYLCTVSTGYSKKGEDAKIFGIQLKLLNTEIKDAINELALELKLELIDVNKITLNHSEWFKTDGVHPSSVGAEEIAKEIGNTIKNNK